MELDLKELLPPQRVGPDVAVPLQLVLEALDLDRQVVDDGAVVLRAARLGVLGRLGKVDAPVGREELVGNRVRGAALVGAGRRVLEEGRVDWEVLA